MDNQQPDFSVPGWIRCVMLLCAPVTLVLTMFSPLWGGEVSWYATAPIAFVAVFSIGVAFNRDSCWGSIAEIMKTWRQ